MIVLAMLVAGAMAGLFVQPFLSDAHRSPETRELSQAVTGMLVVGLALFGVMRNADAWVDVQAVAIQPQWLRQNLSDFSGHTVSVVRSLDTVQQHHEFIAADPRHGVGFPHDTAQPPRGLGLRFSYESGVPPTPAPAK